MAPPAGRGRLHRSLLLLTCISLGCGSSDDASPIDTNADAKRALLSDLAVEVIWPAYRDFDVAADALMSQTSAWAASPQDIAERAAARQAWKDAMGVWQRAELYQIGPAGAMDATADGQDLRDEIYSWPLVNRCRVDQELVEAVYDQPAFATEAVNVRGLDALEYLLFNDSTDNDCAANSTINTDGSWTALDLPELTRRRAAYAEALAASVKVQAASLARTWDPAGLDWGRQLAGAGVDSASYDTAQEALNALTDAMFYLDTETKDMKLAIPAGLSDCAEQICPAALESGLSGRSKANISANLSAFLALFRGAGGRSGIDDLLSAVGRGELATEIIDGVAQAASMIEALPEPLSSALVTDRAAVVAAHGQLSTALLPFKTEFLSVLDLELPQRAEGDND